MSVVRGTASTGEVLLKAENVVVALTNLTCSLELRRGGRTALTGETGAGKTQLLKTLAKLVPATGGRLAGFDGAPPAYRARVAFVSQDRPTVAGSPRDHLDQVLAFGAQRHRDPVQVRSSIGAMRRAGGSPRRSSARPGRRSRAAKPSGRTWRSRSRSARRPIARRADERLRRGDDGARRGIPVGVPRRARGRDA